jgi:hypothetical protein
VVSSQKGDQERELNPKLGGKLKRILTTSGDRIMIHDGNDDLLVVDANKGELLLRLDAHLRRKLAPGDPDLQSPTIGELSGEAIRTFGGELYFPGRKCFLLPVLARPLEPVGNQR